MISIIDTIKGLSEWIEANFDEAPTTKDITEGFARPCTYVQTTAISTRRESDLIHDSYQIEIVRFSDLSHRGYLELLKYQKKFAELLAGGYIKFSNGFVIYPDGIEFELDREDMYLSVTFDLDNYQSAASSDTSPDMQKLLIDNATAYEEEEED